MMFHDRVRKAQEEGRLKGDCGKRRRPCYDCLRAAGLTPPYELRSNYPRLTHRGQPVVMDGVRTFTVKAKKKDEPDRQVKEAERGDPMGRPMPRHKPKAEKKGTKDEQKMAAAEGRHLRDAIANREAI